MKKTLLYIICIFLFLNTLYASESWFNIYTASGNKVGYLYIKRAIVTVKKKKMRKANIKIYALDASKKKFVLRESSTDYANRKFLLLRRKHVLRGAQLKTITVSRQKKHYAVRIKSGGQTKTKTFSRRQNIYWDINGAVIKYLKKLKIRAKGRVARIHKEQMVFSSFEVVGKEQIKTPLGSFQTYKIKIQSSAGKGYSWTHYATKDGRDIKMTTATSLIERTTKEEAKKLSSSSKTKSPPGQKIALVAPKPKAASKFAKNIEAIVNKKDLAAFNKAFDKNILMEIATKDYHIPSYLKDIHFSGALNKFRLGKDIEKNMGKQGSYKFIKVYKKKKDMYALFRLINNDGTFDYHDLLLHQTDGKIKIVDVFVYGVGEFISEKMRRRFLDGLVHFKKDRAKMGLENNEYIKNIFQVVNMKMAGRERKYQQALKKYYALPASVQKEKYFFLLRLKYAFAVGGEEYQRAFDSLSDHFPKPTVEMLSISIYLPKKQFDKALKSVNKLIKIFGKDAYLTVIKAKIYYLQGQKKVGDLLIRKAQSMEPKLKVPVRK